MYDTTGEIINQLLISFINYVVPGILILALLFILILAIIELRRDIKREREKEEKWEKRIIRKKNGKWDIMQELWISLQGYFVFLLLLIIYQKNTKVKRWWKN